MLFDCWDCTAADMPPRSRLYSLKPIGIGTPFVESITGYVSRLADAHAVSVAELVGRELFSLDRNQCGPSDPSCRETQRVAPTDFAGGRLRPTAWERLLSDGLGHSRELLCKRAFSFSRCCRSKVSSLIPDYSATPAPGAQSVMKIGDARMIQSTSPYCGQSDRR